MRDPQLFPLKYLDARSRFQSMVNSLHTMNSIQIHLNFFLHFLFFSVHRKTVNTLYGNCFFQRSKQMQIDELTS